MASGLSALPPSVYVNRLRRAFFLRVHPDRFRSHNVTVRSNQAKLVQVLNNRMTFPDFVLWQGQGSATAPLPASTTIPSESLKYVLEHHDGSLIQKSIQLTDSVDSILASMAEALESSGAASLPPPPKMTAKKTTTMPNDNIVWTQSTSTSSSTQPDIDHRFDINTTRGRDLLAFCETLDRQQVEERRQFRMDANANAAIGRRLYQFQSIDGLSLFWSSRSFAILLRTLIQLHEEHHHQFLVESFYPLRLVFSNNDYNFEEALDLYGGVLHLHPGYTPLQWLEILRKVTPERLKTLQHHRQQLELAQRKIQSALGCRIKKGFTCNSQDYYHFVLKLAHHLPNQEGADGEVVPVTSAVALESIHVVVESADACRFRCIVTQEGQIRVGAMMPVDTVLSAIHRDAAEARRRRDRDRKERAIADERAKQVQWELGLTRKVYKAGTFRISHEDFQKCLQRVLHLEPDQKGRLKLSLGGNALGVAGSGQFCQLGDDGAVIIPHDWAVNGTQEATASAFSS
ncbi:expressed unknown protein [Seminavis robusta]|uniref:DUF4461 domain-containing protein n=1 Tax=Seminavis robusta TaxID=568900 RepID=A0A9N8D4Q8_9STRA|nr:expressed unknown protein [Seminavis robusta]|eukprot:Sro4_g003170.1 n/a (515) ;mRNA; r:63758-65302